MPLQTKRYGIHRSDINLKFTGCDSFSTGRMTWVKTNFLWMMYRCGWATKDKNQEADLAIWLKRSAFERILSMAVSSSASGLDSEEWKKQVSKQKSTKAAPVVRLQWDPGNLIYEMRDVIILRSSPKWKQTWRTKSYSVRFEKCRIFYEWRRYCRYSRYHAIR